MICCHRTSLSSQYCPWSSPRLSMPTNCCPYIEKGVPDGKTIIFMSGFPDSELSCWGEKLIDELCQNHRCIFACLPGYSRTLSNNDIMPWGYKQEEVLLAMHNCIQGLGLSEKFVLMAHDWGAYYALLYTTRYPNAASKLILCDIGMCSPFTLPLTSLPFILFYQLCFAISYFISQAINYTVGEWLFQTIGIRAFFAILSPNRTHVNSAHSELTVEMCYPYYYLLRRLLTGTMLPQAFPTCPLLFMVSHSSVYIRRGTYTQCSWCWWSWRSFYWSATICSPIPNHLLLFNQSTSIAAWHTEMVCIPRPTLSGPHWRHAGLQSLLAASGSLVHDRPSPSHHPTRARLSETVKSMVYFYWLLHCVVLDSYRGVSLLEKCNSKLYGIIFLLCSSMYTSMLKRHSTKYFWFAKTWLLLLLHFDLCPMISGDLEINGSWSWLSVNKRSFSARWRNIASKTNPGPWSQIVNRFFLEIDLHNDVKRACWAGKGGKIFIFFPQQYW